MTCESGRATENPCWREAAEGERYCTEHLKVFDLIKTLEGYYNAITTVNGYVESDEVKNDAYGVLH